MNLLEPIVIERAAQRIASYLHKTPLVSSEVLNHKFFGQDSHRIFFKLECQQKIGAFKARGALNTLLELKEAGSLPEHVVAFSSGNHAQGIALAAKLTGIKATIFMPEDSSAIKKAATRAYGAELILTKTRKETEEKGAQFAAEQGAYLIPSFNHDGVIAGQGTAAYEGLNQMQDQIGQKPDAIFVPCGGGGLSSGTYLAKELLSPKTELYICEPEASGKLIRSIDEDRVVVLDDVPKTIADGTKTLALSERTLQYIKKANGYFAVSEEDMKFWCQWMMHLLKVSVEACGAMPMSAAHNWLQQQQNIKNVLVIVSGGNIDQSTMLEIWSKNYLTEQNLQQLAL